MKKAAILLSSFALLVVTVSGQRSANAPPTGPSSKPPDTVFIEDLTWAEVRDLIGKMGVDFKVNAGIAQYTQLKNPAQGRGRGREGQ